MYPCSFFILNTSYVLGFLGDLDGKESACNVGDLGSILGLGRSPGGGTGRPLQYSCLENPHGQRNLWASLWGCKEPSRPLLVPLSPSLSSLVTTSLFSLSVSLFFFVIFSFVLFFKFHTKFQLIQRPLPIFQIEHPTQLWQSPPIFIFIHGSYHCLICIAWLFCFWPVLESKLQVSRARVVCCCILKVVWKSAWHLASNVFLPNEWGKVCKVWCAVSVCVCMPCEIVSIWPLLTFVITRPYGTAGIIYN